MYHITWRYLLWEIFILKEIEKGEMDLGDCGFKYIV